MSIQGRHAHGAEIFQVYEYASGKAPSSLPDFLQKDDPVHVQAEPLSHVCARSILPGYAGAEGLPHYRDYAAGADHILEQAQDDRGQAEPPSHAYARSIPPSYAGAEGSLHYGGYAAGADPL